MTIDQVAPVELPDFDAKPLMNEQFRKWVEQRRAELEREHSISELAPRVVGVPQRFLTHASRGEIHADLGLTAADLVTSISSWIERPTDVYGSQGK